MTILRTDKIAGVESVNAITGSVFTTGANYLIGPDSTDFEFGSGAFTIEAWIYMTADAESGDDSHTIVSKWFSDTSVKDFIFRVTSSTGNKLEFYWTTNGTTNQNITGNTALVKETWYHVAVTSDGSTIRMFVDGVVQSSTSSGYTYNSGTIAQLCIGAVAGVNGTTPVQKFEGYISNLRICKGKAIYRGAFTPPTRQLEVTPETVLLCCHSSQDPAQEATDKTIVPTTTSTADASPEASTFVPDVGNDHTHGTVLEGNVEFPSLNYMTLPRGTTAQANRGRGTFSGGYTPSPTNTNLASIDYVQIQSLGNSIDFGDLTEGRYGGGSGASSTRGLQIGGRVSSTRVNTIDYITFATTGNAVNFGDLQYINAYVHGASSNTRALNMGGGTPAVTNLIEYVTIASTGNGTDFGYLTDARGGAPAVASPTRACCMGGYDDSSWIDIIDYVTIATTGNATDFGDLSSAFGYGGGLSSNTRGIMGGGSRGSGEINDIVYITIASTGNATDFGDLYAAREHTSATSNSIRGIWGGGVTPTYYNNIQYVTISTTGNANDFGDFIIDASKAYSMSTSDSHGGLSE